MEQASSTQRLGLWLIGARGSIATCVAYGLSGLRQGLIAPIGVLTETEEMRRLSLAPCDAIVLGGHEIASGDLHKSASDLRRHGILSSELVAAGAADAAALDARIRPGLLDGPDVGRADLDRGAAQLGGLTGRAQVEQLTADIQAFRTEEKLDRVIVVNLASTEAWRAEGVDWADLASFERALEDDSQIPASCLYAYAAFQAGAPFVNFTPNLGATPQALRELAQERGLPHCGNDGKTGETLLKTVLAPMFAARALKVHSWQGYNMLGNKDGEALADPVRRESKCRNKDAVLRSILKDPDLHSRVGIDFVPSLHDWKTAWDFIHFEGFLGARMTLQFTWSGSDSVLAAPLIIDLARLTDLSARLGEVGVMDHTACFFKAPLGGGTHDFHSQMQALTDYVAERLPSAAE